LKRSTTGPAAGAIERSQVIEAIDRDGEVDVLALVEDFDAVMLNDAKRGTRVPAAGPVNRTTPPHALPAAWPNLPRSRRRAPERGLLRDM